jgi:hypothetical protein
VVGRNDNRIRRSDPIANIGLRMRFTQPAFDGFGLALILQKTGCPGFSLSYIYSGDSPLLFAGHNRILSFVRADYRFLEASGFV